MTIHYDHAGVVIHHGDCLDVLRELPDASVDAVVTDPPYLLGFMGREWGHPGRTRAPRLAWGVVSRGVPRPEARRPPPRLRRHPHLAPAGCGCGGCGVRDPRLDRVDRCRPATSLGWSKTSVCGRCGAATRREAHATVKPLALMRWLVRLVTPPGGTVLEPFAGSGTTVEACILEGFRVVAIERDETYLPLILQRIHRRRDPVQAVRSQGEDGGLFDLLADEETA